MCVISRVSSVLTESRPLQCSVCLAFTWPQRSRASRLSCSHCPSATGGGTETNTADPARIQYGRDLTPCEAPTRLLSEGSCCSGAARHRTGGGGETGGDRRDRRGQEGQEGTKRRTESLTH
ncbi:unnamed protein product [Pleuronectes platessa]|uniref:Uncharacterized protein n=1 Tax=Pleuronectes platessa TaxID=8262 RepID=A0A9N7Y3Z3_PLEPL|nr:unnamed protein product [Pleuronectes platessa]